MGVIEKQSIQDIADAIRDRNGLTTLYKPRQMDEAILGLYKTEAVNHVFDDLRVNTTKEDTSFTLDDAEGGAEITELKGNTTQEGTPTPSSPVEVKTVSGDNNVVVSNKNIFDGEIRQGNQNYTTTQARLFSKKNDWYFTSGTVLTFSTNLPDTFKVCFYLAKNPYLSGTYSAMQNFSYFTNGQTTITLNANGYLGFTIAKVSEANITPSEVEEYNFQIEKGTQATEYIEHQGNSYRVDLGGKNLLNLNATQTKSGITCTNNGDGSITLNGTATANMDLWIANGTSANVIVKSMCNGTALTQRINVKSGSYTGTAYFETVTYNGTTNNYTNLRGDVTYTFTYNGWIKPTEIFISNGSVFNNWTIQPQLEYGSQATPYSPYTDNPIELCKIGNYQDKLLQSTGKNLFDVSYYKNATYNTENFYSYTPLKVKGGRYLVIRVTLKNGKSAVSGAYLNISTGYGTPASVNAGQTITGISNGTAVTRSLNFTEDTLYLNIAGNIQDILDNYDIMLATSNIPYEPYGVGKWYVEKNIGKANLEDYNWTKYGTSIENISRFATTGIPNVKYVANNRQLGDALSNYYQNHTGSGMSSVAYYFCIDTNMVQATDDSSLTKPRGVLYYALATPTYIEITDTYLLNQLNNILDIELYEDLCYVDFVGIEKPTMKLTYYVDTDKILEKLREE